MGECGHGQNETPAGKTLAAGAQVAQCFLDVPFEELWNRIANRNAARPADTFEISRNDVFR
ncbi:hypothetical protein ASE94_00080 [Devosia sp. Leaf64]|nr:hypothetical protein ASE94_00080 [Devosia sp. Leaf64]